MNGLRTRLTGVTAREVEDGLLLLDTESGQIHQLNLTASLIWHNCDRAASVEELAGLIASEFDVEHDIAARDVEATLTLLRALKLLEEM